MGFEKGAGKEERIFLAAVKDQYIGYLKDVFEEKNKFGKDQWHFKLVNPETGRDVEVMTSGTAKYLAHNLAAALGYAKSDPKREKDEKEILACKGYLVALVRTGSYTEKNNNKEVSTWRLDVDREKPLHTGELKT